ncbi:MAG: formate/nitrite transporter family protein [Candidatus Lambdaproteobacteria bacterium]|nr:formate/nitrite transporter family protein [Candidatus Lambdaproteobacteria bacterium]
MTIQPPAGGTVPGPFDALIPAAIARRAEEVGQAKARMDAGTVLALAVLAGAFIALGALFFTTVTTGAAGAMPYGAARLLGGLAFCLGLVLVVLAGAELFTGNNLIVMAWIGGSVSAGQLLRNWALVYAGNLVGSLATVALVYFSGQYRFAGGAVGAQALAIASAKVSLGFWEPLFLGTLCNALVCLAIWLTMGAHSTTDKVVAILFPISAFVAIGFEHSVANMYFVPIGLLIKSDRAFLASLGKTAADYAGLTWGAFIVDNLVPVTLGNIIGGAGLVGAVYWFVYLRKPAAR